MPRWKAGLLVASALVAVNTVAAAARPALPPAVAAPAAPVCGERPAPAGTVTDLPWPQRRYAPERLAPLATGAGVMVAVIDSGVDAQHPQLRARIARGTDFLDPRGDGTVDCVGHGTAVASIIAAEPRRNVGFRGLAPGARILPVRVSEQSIVDGRAAGRTVTPAQFAQAIRWAVDHGADVLNLSVVLYQDDPAVRSAVRYALDRDVVVVAAVGNAHDSGDPTPYPAAYSGVLGVGAVGADGARARFSQVGRYVDVMAPGSEVLAATVGRGHAWYEGTSYAVPFVSATAALVREYRPDLSAADVVRRIVATADPAPAGSDEYGSGVVNPYRAVTDTTAAGRPTPPPAPLVAHPDPTDHAELRRRAQTRETALWLAGASGCLAGMTVLVATVLPRGARRRWQPAA
jgi:type VII secretion-associated serine protease mycosin